MDAVQCLILVPSFSAFLEAQLEDSPPPRKGLRTRARLIIAAVKMFDALGYLETRVSDITSCAGVAEGSFYIYFKDKADVAVEVLTEFFDEYTTSILVPEGDWESDFSRIRFSIRRWIAFCRANPGVMHCTLKVGDHVPEIAQVARRTREIWDRGLVRAFGRRRDAPIDADLVLLLTHMLAGMADDLIRKLLVVPDPSFLSLLERLGGGDETLADAIGLIWHQLFYGALPIDAEISPAARLIADLLWRPPADGRLD